jgi:hypothetical protein
LSSNFIHILPLADLEIGELRQGLVVLAGEVDLARALEEDEAVLIRLGLPGPRVD